MDINNEVMCRLLRLQYKDFYDNIYIPYKFFRQSKWNVEKVISDNDDALFFNKNYMTNNDLQLFADVFKKYTDMICKILQPENKLYEFMKRWTNFDSSRWSDNGINSYLKQILTHYRYQYISPTYITDVFYEISKNNINDPQKIRNETEKHLKGILVKVHREKKKFNEIFNNIVSCYVYEYPNNETDENKSLYETAFINAVIIASLEFANKLLDLNVYAIHPIINQIIIFYLPLDDFNSSSNVNSNDSIYVV